MSSAIGRGQRHAQLRVREHIRPVGECDGALRALLDEQDRDAAVADFGERAENRVDERRREAERRLIEEEHVGSGHECAADRQLLLLAAGECSGLTVAEFGEHREELVRRAERVGAVAAAGREPEPQVLLDGQLTEDAPALRHERDSGARDRLRRAAPHRVAGEADVPGRRRDDTHDRVQRRRLAGAVRPDQADELAATDLEIQRPNSRHRAVPDMKVLQLEDGTHSATALSPRYADVTSRLRRISAGAPSARVLP